MKIKVMVVCAMVILMAGAIWAVLYGKPVQCSESACKPTWATDCVCGSGQRMDVLPDGTVLCRCPAR